MLLALDAAPLFGGGGWEVFAVQQRVFAARQHLGQAGLELLDQLVAHRMAEGEAELLRAQHPLLLEEGGVEFLLDDQLLHGGLVGGDQIDPAGGEHLERLCQPVGGHQFALVKAVVEQQLLPHIGPYRPDIERLGIVELGDGDIAIGQPHQHDLGIPDGAGPLEQGIPRLGTSGGEEHRIGLLGQQVVTARPRHDGDGLRRRISLFPYQLQQLDCEAGGGAAGIGVVVGFVLFGDVVQFAELRTRLCEGGQQRPGQSNPWFHFCHPDQGNICSSVTKLADFAKATEHVWQKSAGARRHHAPYASGDQGVSAAAGIWLAGPRNPPRRRHGSAPAERGRPRCRAPDG